MTASSRPAFQKRRSPDNKRIAIFDRVFLENR
jgi:hypothetical protein